MSVTRVPPIFFVSLVVTFAASAGNANAAALSGRITAAPGVAAPAPLSVAVDTSTCTAPESKTVPDPRLVIGEKRALADVVVRVRGVPDAPPYAAGGEVLLDQQACEFVPHVVVVAPGQTLRVKNSDSILHTFRTVGDTNRTVNKAQTGGKEDVFIFENPGILTAECDVHYWMSAVVVVAPDKFTAATGKDGEFALDGLPPGKYDVELWHQVLGTKSAAVEVGTDGGRIELELGPADEADSAD